MEVGIAGYAEALHPVIAVLLREQEELEYLVRRGIDARQTALLPKLGWGNKENPGVFQIMLECFGRYETQFKAASQDSLREKATMADYLKIMSTLNNDLARASHEEVSVLASYQSRSNKGMTYDDIHHSGKSEEPTEGYRRKPLSKEAAEYKRKHTIRQIL